MLNLAFLRASVSTLCHRLSLCICVCVLRNYDRAWEDQTGLELLNMISLDYKIIIRIVKAVCKMTVRMIIPSFCIYSVLCACHWYFFPCSRLFHTLSRTCTLYACLRTCTCTVEGMDLFMMCLFAGLFQALCSEFQKECAPAVCESVTRHLQESAIANNAGDEHWSV